MYIPHTPASPEHLAARWAVAATEQQASSSSGSATATATTGVSLASLDRFFIGLRRILTPATHQATTGELRRRNSVTDTNITVGVIVGVLLGLFLIGCFTFLWIYRNSIVFSRHRRRQRRKSASSSKASSKASDSGAPPPPPAEGG